MDRRAKLLSMFDAKGFGLEIGPSYNPLLRKADGYTIETLDYADQASLVAKYAKTQDVDVSRIEAVDHVSDGRPMAEIIGRRHCYDFIIASHVIEHTPDLIGFLKNCEELLRPDGRLILAVPDKRSCFDVFQSLTSTGHVLEAHRQKLTRPAQGSLFDAIAYGATRDGHIGWSKSQCDKRQLHADLEHALSLVGHAEKSSDYIDVHVWRFVPSSFRLILNDLFEGGYTGLRIREMHCEQEMLVSLDRSGADEKYSRLELLEGILDEQAVSSLAHALLSQAFVDARDKIKRQETELKNIGHQTGPDRDVSVSASSENAQHEQGLAQLKAELIAKEVEILALRQSHSWRLTQPLRRLSMFLQRP